MNYVYHHVPPEMSGTILYPLNVLKDNFPNLYSLHIRKYQGREQLLESRIPILDCLWNDVLHFTPIPPEELMNVIVECGGFLKRTTKSYKIPVTDLPLDRTVIYLYKQVGDRFPKTPDNFIPFDPQLIGDMTMIPEVTKEYFRQSFGKSEKPLLYHLVPHILYKGELDISKYEIV